MLIHETFDGHQNRVRSSLLSHPVQFSLLASRQIHRAAVLKLPVDGGTVPREMNNVACHSVTKPLHVGQAFQRDLMGGGAGRIGFTEFSDLCQGARNLSQHGHQAAVRGGIVVGLKKETAGITPATFWAAEKNA